MPRAGRRRTPGAPRARTSPADRASRRCRTRPAARPSRRARPRARRRRPRPTENADLEQDLARLAAGVLGGGAVGVDHLRRLLGVRERPEPVAPAPGDPRRLRPERRHVDRRPPLRAGVQVGAAWSSSARPSWSTRSPSNRRVDQLERLLHALDLLADRRPVGAERRLVQRLARAEAQVGTAGEHRLQRRPRLGDQRPGGSAARGRDPGADRHALGRLPGGAEPDPGVARLARLPPRLEVVAAADAVEAGAPRPRPPGPAARRAGTARGRRSGSSASDLLAVARRGRRDTLAARRARRIVFGPLAS